MIFGQDYNNLGGTTTGGPIEKKGFARFGEILLDNTGRFFAANTICVLCAIPGGILIASGVYQDNALVMLLGCLLAGVMVGPAFGVLTDAVLMGVRDIPGAWWKRYRMVWKRDWKGYLVPGLLLGVLVAVTANVAMGDWESGDLPLMLLVCTLITIVLFFAVSTYFWPQRALLDLNLFQIIKNSLFMCVIHPLVTLGVTVLQVAYWGLIATFVPRSLIFLIVTGFWLPEFVTVFLSYRALDQELKIEKRLGNESDDDEEEIDEYGEEDGQE
ncbi:MAG: hypothetical protein LIO45_02515 [Clostridiales bacterium]|nr:hypothetical protein [Clostridiales bacterium]